MHVFKIAILWLHIFLPAISLLLTQAGVLGLARAQQQQARMLSNFINLKSKAAVAKLHRKLNNKMAKYPGFVRTKRQVDSGTDVRVVDKTPDFAQSWFGKDTRTAVHQENIENSDGAWLKAVQNPNQFIAVPIGIENTNGQTQKAIVVPSNPSQLRQNTQLNNVDAQTNSEQLDQQREAMVQLRNMWNMNRFANNQGNIDIVRTAEEEMLESPDPHFIKKTPKIHSKAISIAKDKNSGASSFSYSSYNQWRNAHKNEEDDDQDETSVKKQEISDPETLEYLQWLKEKEDEAKFNKAIQDLVDNPPRKFEENQMKAEQKSKKHDEQNPKARTGNNLLNKFYGTKPRLLENKIKPVHVLCSCPVQGYYDNKGYYRNADVDEQREMIDRVPEFAQNIAPAIHHENLKNTNNASPTTVEHPSQFIPVATGTEHTNGQIQEAIVVPSNPSQSTQTIQLKNVDAQTNSEQLVGSKLDQQSEAMAQLQNMWNMNGFANNQGNMAVVRTAEQEMLERNPEARSADKLYKKYLKKLKLLEKKMKKDIYDYPSNYYSPHAGYSGYHSNSGYDRSADHEDSAEENPEVIVRLAEELENENRNFPGHDPNHSGHVDGRCADVDKKLYDEYTKELEKLYKKIQKKTYSVPVITPYYDTDTDQYNNGYEGYTVNDGYNRNAKTQNEKLKTADKNSTDPHVSAASPTFFNNDQQLPDFVSHQFEEGTQQSQLAREPLPHFKGGFTHSHAHSFKKDFGVSPLTPNLPPPPGAPIQINLNANSFANSGTSAGSSQQQQQSAAANTFASTGSQHLPSGNRQQAGANSFANAAVTSSKSLRQRPVFINRQQSAAANSFANVGSQQFDFDQQQKFSNEAFQQQGAQFSVQPAPVWENREHQSFAQANAQTNAQANAPANAQANQNNFQTEFLDGQTNQQKSFAHSNAQTNSNHFPQGLFNGASAQSNAQAFANSFQQADFSSGASAQAQASSFTQSPVTFGLSPNSQSFASASANAGSQSPWLGARSPIPHEEFVNDGESFIPSPKFERRAQNPTENKMSFVTNIVDESLKLGGQLNNQNINSEQTDDTMRSVTGIVSQSMSLSNDAMTDEEHRQRSSGSAGPLTRLLDGDLRLKRQTDFEMNDMMEQNQQMNFQNFQRMQEMNQFQPLHTQNFFLNQEMQNPPQNFMSDQIPQMEQRSNFPSRENENLQMPQMVNTLDQESKFSSQMQQLRKQQQAFNEVNNRDMQLQETINNNNQQTLPEEQQVDIQNFSKPNKVQQNTDIFIPQDQVNNQEPQSQGNVITNTAFRKEMLENNDANKQSAAVLPKQTENQLLNEKEDFQKQSTMAKNPLPQHEIKEDDDKIISAPLPSHFREEEDSSEEQSSLKPNVNTISTAIKHPSSIPTITLSTPTLPTPAMKIHPTTKTASVKTVSSVPSDHLNVTVPKQSMLDIIDQAEVSVVFKNIDEDLKLLTPEQKQEFIRQELELLTEMVIENLKKNGSAVMKDFVNTSAAQKEGNFNTTLTQSPISKDSVVTRPNLFQAPYDMTSSARQSFYKRPEYSRSANNFDDTRLGMQNLEDHFDTILTMQHNAVQHLKEKAQNDGDLLMISWIGEGIVKDLENRRDKSNTRRKREIPLSIRKLVSDPHSKVDITKTFDNLGAVTRHVIENSKAPMYHVRSMIGNAKNSVMAAVKAAPNNFLIPSKYEITNVDHDNKVGSINRRLLKEKIIQAAKHRKASGKQTDDSSGIVDTFHKLGSILKDSVDSGKQSVAHASDLAMDARNVLYTAKNVVPRIIAPPNNLLGVTRSVENRLPKKAVLVAPRILDVAETGNLLGEGEAVTNEKFVALGEILDNVGITNPDKNDFEIEKIVMQPETLEVLEQLIKGIPKELKPSTTVKDWFENSLKADQPTNDGADYNNDRFGNSINTIQTLDETKRVLGAKNFKDLVKNMRLQMRNAVKDHRNINNKQRRKMKKARILKKYKGIPVRQESVVPNLTSRRNQLSSHTTEDASVPESRMKDVQTKRIDVDETIESPLRIAKEVVKHKPVTKNSSTPFTTKPPSVATNTNEQRSNVVENFKQLNQPEEQKISTNMPEELNQKLGLYLPPELMRPFMGRASNNQLNQFLRENNDPEDIGRITNVDKITKQRDTTPTMTSQNIASTTPESKHGHQFDSEALTHILGAMNPRMFEKYFNERYQGATEGQDKKKIENPQIIVDNVSQHVKSHNLNVKPNDGIFNKDKGFTPISTIEVNHKLNQTPADQPPEKTVVKSSQILDKNEYFLENNKAKFNLMPSEELYTKPFMGKLDKNLIKEFLKQYYHMEDSSSLEQPY